MQASDKSKEKYHLTGLLQNIVDTASNSPN